MTTKPTASIDNNNEYELCECCNLSMETDDWSHMNICQPYPKVLQAKKDRQLASMGSVSHIEENDPWDWTVCYICDCIERGGHWWVRTYYCISDTHDPDNTKVYTEDAFEAMCLNCFGEAPELQEQGHEGILHEWVGQLPICHGHGEWVAVLIPVPVSTSAQSSETTAATTST